MPDTPEAAIGHTPHPERVRNLDAAIAKALATPTVRSDGPMGFPQAVMRLLDGKKVRRSSWPASPAHLFLTDAWLMLHKPDNAQCQALLQRGDLEGEDWVVVP